MFHKNSIKLTSAFIVILLFIYFIYILFMNNNTGHDKSNVNGLVEDNKMTNKLSLDNNHINDDKELILPELSESTVTNESHDIVKNIASNKLSGNVIDYNNNNVFNACVFLLDYDNHLINLNRSYTNEYGFFAIANIRNGSYKLIADHPDYAPSDISTLYNLINGNIDNICLMLKEGLTITGYVLDEYQNIIIGACIDCEIQGGSIDKLNYILNNISNDEGKYLIKGIDKTSNAIDLIISAVEYVTQRINIKLNKSDSVLNINIILQRCHKINGLICDLNGNQNENKDISILCINNKENIIYRPSFYDGCKYEFEVTSGYYDIHVYYNRGVSQVSDKDDIQIADYLMNSIKIVKNIPYNTSDMVIYIDDQDKKTMKTLKGLVTDIKTNEPISNCMIIVKGKSFKSESKNNNDIGEITYTDKNGLFSLQIMPGIIKIVATQNGYHKYKIDNVSFAENYVDFNIKLKGNK